MKSAEREKFRFAGAVVPAWVFICAALLVTACPDPGDLKHEIVQPDTDEDELQKYSITLGSMADGSFDVTPSGAQYETHTVTLAARPEPGSKYRPGSLKVRGVKSGKEVKTQAQDSPAEWTFTMPSEAVEINAAFIGEDAEVYDIAVDETDNGSVKCAQTDAVAGDTVTLILTPDDGFRHKEGSLKVTPNVEDLTKVSEDSWSFIMPENAVTITALFEEIPLFGIVLQDIEHGTLTAEPYETAQAGAEVIITLNIDDPGNYRYASGSIDIIQTDSGSAPDYQTAGNLSWVFIMPAAEVTISAKIEFIPRYNIIAKNSDNGAIIIDGEARAGKTITITALPQPGYTLVGAEPAVTPVDAPASANAVAVTKLDGQAAWSFTMPEYDVEITVNFAALSPLEIYKGGARRGITVGALSDDSKFHEESIVMDSEEKGRNGNLRALKISHAVNEKGNTVQQSFGLFSDTEIDLSNVAALSFLAKANKALNIRYVGFGDADPDKRIIYTGESFNQIIPITTEWKRFIVPVPSPLQGQKTTRVFMFNAQLSNGNYVCVDDIEFVKTGVSLTEITIPDSYDFTVYGSINAEKIFTGLPSKLIFACSDGTVATLQGANNSHTLKYNLNRWLTPFVEVNGNTELLVNIAGKKSNTMTANVVDGITLDDFESPDKNTIPVNPAAATQYIWHTNASGAVLTRDYISGENNEIFGGLAAGNWRPAADAKAPRGGRNFEPVDASDYDTLSFRIRVTAGTAAGSNYQKNTVFSFELKNGGTLTNKTNGNFFARQFTYNTDNADGWQEVKIKLSELAYVGAVADEAQGVPQTPALDTSAITGYAFGVLDNQGAALRIALDDIVIITER